VKEENVKEKDEEEKEEEGEGGGEVEREKGRRKEYTHLKICLEWRPRKGIHFH
jgi:hypothetical protein